MKKLFALLLIAVLALGAVAVAEEAAVQLAFDETAAPYAGEWIAFEEDGFRIYLPGDWVLGDVEEEVAAQGGYAYASTQDGTQVIVFMYNEVGEADAAAMLQGFALVGATNMAEVVLNGIPAIVYDMEAANLTSIAFLDGLGGMYTFSATPADDVEFAPIGQSILLSISPIE